MSDIAIAKLFIFNYLVLITMGSRANTIAHTASKLQPSGNDYELKELLTNIIAKGSAMALNHCRDQFRWERWNCPQTSFYKSNDEPATREAAFISSISAAGIVYSITRACSKGILNTCGCSKRPAPKMLEKLFAPEKGDSSSAETKAEWTWSGCSDDVSFADKVATIFLRSLQEGQADVLARVNEHNNRLGRMIVREHIRPQCKCHGVSGSCGTKTCWYKLAPFHEIGSVLKYRYQRAQRIQLNTATRNVDLKIPESQMVFLAESEDYCKPNKTTGWPGTGGRICSKRKDEHVYKSERRSCRELCRSCGHQVKQRPLNVTWHCNCTFHWCCKVSCSTCEKTIVQHYCDDTPKHY